MLLALCCRGLELYAEHMRVVGKVTESGAQSRTWSRKRRFTDTCDFAMCCQFGSVKFVHTTHVEKYKYRVDDIARNIEKTLLIGPRRLGLFACFRRDS